MVAIEKITERIRVLLVDDDITIRVLIKKVLMTKHIETHNSVQGIESVVERFDPHVIILDYHLLDGTAIDVLKKIKKYCKKSIPIIYTCMPLEEPEKTQLYINGAMNIISKPCHISTIESIVENYYEVSMKYRS